MSSASSLLSSVIFLFLGVGRLEQSSSCGILGSTVTLVKDVLRDASGACLVLGGFVRARRGCRTSGRCPGSSQFLSTV